MDEWPDEWGDTSHAFAMCHAGARATDEQSIAFTRDQLAHFKAPRAVSFVTELPQTATGKVQKYVLRNNASAVVSQ